MEQNPYAPPTDSSEPPPDGLVFSAQGVQVVANMAKWMRGLSFIYYFGAGMGLLAISWALLSGAPGEFVLIMAVAALVGGGMAIALATLIRDAAGYFEKGVVGDDEFSLGQGFRKLRTLFIVFGVVGILGLLSTLSELMEAL